MEGAWAAAMPIAAEVQWKDAVTMEGVATAAPSPVAEGTTEDAVTTPLATLAGASVSASMPRPATAMCRRSAILPASMTKVAFGIIILVVALHRTAIERLASSWIRHPHDPRQPCRLKV